MNGDRDLCANCGHWREEHYDQIGAWQGNLFACPEYYGDKPDEARAANKPDELRASAAAIQKLRADRAAAFYSTAPALR